MFDVMLVTLTDYWSITYGVIDPTLGMGLGSVTVIGTFNGRGAFNLQWH